MFRPSFVGHSLRAITIVRMVTIGTWNLENLFRPGDDSGPKSSQEYESKLDALASTITDLAPDVLAVQEDGDPHALDDLVERLNGT